MVESPPYKRFLIACLLVLALSSTLNGLIPKGPPVDLTHGYMTIGGYVASKKFGSIWLVKEPVSIWERLAMNLALNSNYTIVSRHDEANKFSLFSGLKVNQRVRVYGDHLRESSPSQIKAYYIEKIDGDDAPK
ncbi:DUF3221 domain-containing protein [Virgibacillus sp. C22-A2]|uniref:DUF3221 domain-containing protein n=1 Tax=Virgibacillus tibetensis TaxID=3042313 RepID=A0ABU6KHJ6_9BACI|nr:DUF3221 domain-containing protein [Virgibacillus sp. C22-A2]